MSSISIIKAGVEHCDILADLAARTFLESHGHSGPAEDINTYVREKYTFEILAQELSDKKNIYHLITFNNIPAGFSKIIYDVSHPEIPISNATKLERIYVLKEFYDQKLGWHLYLHNEKLSRANNQGGMWLYVWKQNDRAVKFYRKLGFREAGSFDFPISPTHSNPNFRMYLAFD